MRNLTICSKLAVLPQPTINLSINQFSSLLYQLLRSRQKLSQSQFQATRWYRFSESVFFQRQMFVCPAGVKATIAANMLPIQMRLTEAALKKHMESHHFRFVHDSSTKSHSQTINAQKSFRMRTKLGKSSKTEQNMSPSNPALSLQHL